MVSFSNFRMLNPEMADITRELLDDVYQRHSPFMSFMHTWMAFNGWMETVTGGGPDAAMIDALVGDRRLIETYNRLIGETLDFTKSVAAFSTHWPVLSVKDVRKKLGNDSFWKMTRQDLLEDCRAGGVRMQPREWIAGASPDWPQLLRTIYQVRCNLFHGAKSPENLRDRELVGHADIVLRQFIGGSGCFDWHD